MSAGAGLECSWEASGRGWGNQEAATCGRPFATATATAAAVREPDDDCGVPRATSDQGGRAGCFGAQDGGRWPHQRADQPGSGQLDHAATLVCVWQKWYDGSFLVGEAGRFVREWDARRACVLEVCWSTSGLTHFLLLLSCVLAVEPLEADHDTLALAPCCNVLDKGKPGQERLLTGVHCCTLPRGDGKSVVLYAAGDTCFKHVSGTIAALWRCGWPRVCGLLSLSRA